MLMGWELCFEREGCCSRWKERVGLEGQVYEEEPCTAAGHGVLQGEVEQAQGALATDLEVSRLLGVWDGGGTGPSGDHSRAEAGASGEDWMWEARPIWGCLGYQSKAANKALGDEPQCQECMDEHVWRDDCLDLSPSRPCLVSWTRMDTGTWSLFPL